MWIRIIALHFFNLGSKRVWVVNAKPRPIYPAEGPWYQRYQKKCVGLGVERDGCGKPCQAWGSNCEPSNS